MQRKTPIVRGVVVVSIFTVASALGGLVKLGTPVGSIALDSSAGYFVAAYFSPVWGAAVGFLGHLASAATGGLPLSWLHLIIALLQGTWSFLFGFLVRKFDNWWVLIVACLLAVLLNGIVAPVILTVFQPDLTALLRSLIPMLLAASLMNVIVASIAVAVLAKSRSRRL